MNRNEHHALSIGLLAQCYKFVPEELMLAIEQSIQTAVDMDIGFPPAATAKLKETQCVPMILYCPNCGTQHVDGPEPETGWANPPHKSHLCHCCGMIWRPSDVATIGVADITTSGDADMWVANPAENIAAPALRPNAQANLPPEREARREPLKRQL